MSDSSPIGGGKYERYVRYVSTNEHHDQDEIIALFNNAFEQHNIDSPFTHLPRILVKYLVMESTNKLNFFSIKHGVSNYFIPGMIMHKENLD